MSADLVQSAPTAVVHASEADPLAAWLGSYAGPTREAYRRDLTQWQTWCDAHGVDVLHPLPGHLTQWTATLNDQGRSPATLARKVATLASFYKFCRHNGVTTADPMPLRRPKVHTDDTAKLGLDRDQLRRVLAESKLRGTRTTALVAVLSFTGVRISEALGADVADLGEQSGHHTLRVIGKGNRPRTVVLPAPVWAALSAYLADRNSGALFVTSTGKRLDRQAAYGTVRAVGKAVGVELHPHLLRHTAATIALDAGSPLDRVQALLGHSSPAMTVRYSQARDRLNTSASYDVARYVSD